MAGRVSILPWMQKVKRVMNGRMDGKVWCGILAVGGYVGNEHIKLTQCSRCGSAGPRES